MGVNSQTIGYLERGDYKPSLELAMKIARHFGVSVEMLFAFERFEFICNINWFTGLRTLHASWKLSNLDGE